MSDLPRGIRLHNPGNIRKGDRWKGLDTPSDDGSFCRFKSAPYGIRALAVVLETYQDRRLAADGSAIDTVREVVERWAPPVENDTESYIHSVRQATGFKPGQHIDVHDFGTAMALCKAIIRHENGSQPYSDAELAKGLHLAGIEAPHAPLKKSRTITGAQVAGGATVLGDGRRVRRPSLGSRAGRWHGFRLLQVHPPVGARRPRARRGGASS